MRVHPRQDIAEALEILGSAWRSDWSDFDGRHLKNQLHKLADSARRGSPLDVESWAHSEEICPIFAVWHENCDDKTGSCPHYEAWLVEKEGEEYDDTSTR